MEDHVLANGSYYPLGNVKGKELEGLDIWVKNALLGFQRLRIEPGTQPNQFTVNPIYAEEFVAQVEAALDASYPEVFGIERIGTLVKDKQCPANQIGIWITTIQESEDVKQPEPEA